MKTLSLSIPTSLGEIINSKWHLDTVKNQYAIININFNTSIWDVCLHTEALDWEYKKSLWNKFLDDIGNLFFSERPYLINRKINYPFFDVGRLVERLNIFPQKAEMGYLLCDGYSLNLEEEYIVITTKARQLNKSIFFSKSPQLWNVLYKLSQKYKIVILGERLVEIRKEYGDGAAVFSIYEQIIVNLPNDRILDLTVPALGETVADLKDIRQDCLIMKEAKFVITLGVGGNFCMSTASSNMSVGFRTDDLEFTNAIYKKEYPNAIITKDWSYFIQTLEKYL
jgi:hypothetical protein